MYYVVFGFLWLVSLLPLWALYRIADGIYFLVYYVFRYRKDIVMHNLDQAFPGKTAQEKKAIAKQFYHNLIDTFIETIKMISASPRMLDRRMLGNWEVINQFRDSGRSVQLHLGHNFNWEWGNIAASKNLAMTFLAAIGPVASLAFHGSAGVLRAAYSGNYFGLASPLALDWVAGALLGLPLGLSWSGSMIEKRHA